MLAPCKDRTRAWHRLTAAQIKECGNRPIDKSVGGHPFGNFIGGGVGSFGAVHAWPDLAGRLGLWDVARSESEWPVRDVLELNCEMRGLGQLKAERTARSGGGTVRSSWGSWLRLKRSQRPGHGDAVRPHNSGTSFVDGLACRRAWARLGCPWDAGCKHPRGEKSIVTRVHAAS